MASIILSFVGKQDPVSDGTREDGSIVSLVRHLMADCHQIKRVFLLYTSGNDGTQERAELTRGWLMDEPFYLSSDSIELISTGEALSDDPVNVWLSVQAARQGLELALADCSSQDILEFNGSSGTPVMKSALSVLQAAGYAPRSRLWQVRNPKEKKPYQSRVFQSNVQALRQEFDLKIVKQQLQDYNYIGALTTLKASRLSTPRLEALLSYGHCRLSLDFDRAQDALKPVSNIVNPVWLESINLLLQRDSISLLKEAYFNAIVELKIRKFSDFLVRVFQFQEKALHLFVDRYLSQHPALPRFIEETEYFWKTLASQYPDLYQFLEVYQFRGTSLRLERFPSRPILLAILEYAQSPVLEILQQLNTYCEKRNYYIHHFEGISELEDVESILRTMREVLLELGHEEFTNPFNLLNQEILHLLHKSLQ